MSTIKAFRAGVLAVLACGAAHGARAQSPPDTVSYRLSSAAAPSRNASAILRFSDSVGCEWFRIAGIALRADSGLIVANAGNHQLCIFSAAGRLIRRVGREGAGPGEYRDISALMQYTADSVLVLDYLLRRITVLDSAGRFGRSIGLPPPPAGCGSLGLTSTVPGGGIVVGYSESLNPPPQAAPLDVTQQVLRIDRTGKVQARLGRFPLQQIFAQATPDFGPGSVSYWPLSFGRRLGIARAPRGFYAGDGKAWSVGEYSVDGRLTAVHRLDLPVRRLSAADIAEERNAIMARASDKMRPAFAKRAAAMPYPSTLPAYRRLLSDSEGKVFLETYPAPGESITRWVVLDPKSHVAWDTTLPIAFAGMAVRGGRLCGVTHDELDLESVVCYAVLPNVPRGSF